MRATRTQPNTDRQADRHSEHDANTCNSLNLAACGLCSNTGACSLKHFKLSSTALLISFENLDQEESWEVRDATCDSFSVTTSRIAFKSCCICDVKDDNIIPEVNTASKGGTCLRLVMQDIVLLDLHLALSSGQFKPKLTLTSVKSIFLWGVRYSRTNNRQTDTRISQRKQRFRAGRSVQIVVWRTRWA